MERKEMKEKRKREQEKKIHLNKPTEISRKRRKMKEN